MRVFVTGTGRCGSVSFREACRYITNYRSGHESLCGLLEYPDQFIEVNPQLREVIPHLAAKYPDAKWVHLVRDPVTCIKSLVNLDDGDVVRCYARLFPTIVPSGQLEDIAFRMYWSIVDSIRAQLASLICPAMRREMCLESIKEDWRGFWNWIGADGNLEGSIGSWDIKRNTTEERRGIR